MEFFNGAMRRVSAMASTVRIEAAEAFKAKAAEIREAIGPEKAEPVTVPERPLDAMKAVTMSSKWSGRAIRWRRRMERDFSAQRA